MIDDPYEGSWRQRRHKRRVRIVAAVLALSLVVPILVSAISSIAR